MICPKCKNPLELKKQSKTIYRVCQNCNPFGLNTERAKKHAQELANKYPEKLVILAECDCDKKKYKHHPDYSKPFEVEMLCRSCHWKRHEEAEPGFNSTWEKRGIVPIYLRNCFV